MTSNCTIFLHNAVHICADVQLGSTKIAKYEWYRHFVFVSSGKLNVRLYVLHTVFLEGVCWACSIGTLICSVF